MKCSAGFVCLFVVLVAVGWLPAAFAGQVIVIEKGETPPASAETTTTVTREKPLPVDPAPAVDGPMIQLALLLDTSNSMDGLINQAKAQLWAIVNELAATRRHGQLPTLQVALFEYGNDSLPAEEGYIRQVVPFTTNLDKLSQELFALTTNGGSEYCGQVIDNATEVLTWADKPDAFKVLFIAGNEPFTQGQTPYAEAIAKARQQDITVNTIHCGGYEAGVSGHWRDGAALGHGEYLNIDQNRTVVYIKSPYDEKLSTLNVKLNKTYIWYGDAGRAAREAQMAADEANARFNGEAIMGRIKTKAQSNAYRQEQADLVDASTREDFEMDDVEVEALPEAMQDMTVEERQAYVQQQAEARAALQQQIKELSAKREAYVAKQRQQQAEAEQDATLGEAVVQAVRQQAAANGFEPEQSSDE